MSTLEYEHAGRFEVKGVYVRTENRPTYPPQTNPETLSMFLKPAAPTTPASRTRVALDLETEVVQINRRLERLERMEATINEIKTSINEYKAVLGARGFGEDTPDHSDMKADEIKDLILRKYDLSKLTYPSDIAFDHGLDYDEVLAAVELLRKEGRVQYDEG